MKTIHNFIIIFAFFVIPHFGLSQKSTPASKFENVVSKTIYSEILKENRQLYIYQPDSNSNNIYPVLYLLDGHANRLWQEAIEYVQTNPHIIIGISTSENRNRDMIPIEISSRPGSGGSDQFIQFLKEELMLFVESTFSSLLISMVLN